jgi:hypothetical protein
MKAKVHVAMVVVGALMLPYSLPAFVPIRVPVDPEAAKTIEAAVRDAQQEGNTGALQRNYRRWLELYPNEPAIQAGIYNAMSLMAERMNDAEQAKELRELARRLDPSIDTWTARDGPATRGALDKFVAALSVIAQTTAVIQQTRTQYQQQKQMQPPMVNGYAYPPVQVGAPGYQPPVNPTPMPGYGAPQGYQPPTGYTPPTGVAGYDPNAVPQGYQPPVGAPPTGYQPPVGYAPQGTPQGYQPPVAAAPTGYQPPTGYAPQGYQPPVGAPPTGYQPPVGYAPQGTPQGYQPPVGAPPTGYQPPTGYAPQGSPQGYQPPVAAPPTGYQPATGYPPQGTPQVYQPVAGAPPTGYQPPSSYLPGTPQGYQPPAGAPPTGYQPATGNPPQGTPRPFPPLSSYQPQATGYPQPAAASPATAGPYRAPMGYARRQGFTRGEGDVVMKVVHDHSQLGATAFFEPACGALLAVENGNLTFTPGGGEAPLVIPASEIREIRINSLVGKDVGAFHISTKQGLYLDLAPDSGASDEGHADVETLRKQLGLGE